jgi:phosphoribosyl 1,2-cyclic phosphate phosphodiesterase
MEVVILGTAAAEGCPALFCDCENCARARSAGGREVRARQAAFLPPDVLIDMGPDLLYAAQRFGLNLHGVDTILVTHSHADHLTPDNLAYAKPPFAHNRHAPLKVWGNEAVISKIEEARKEAGSEGYELRPARLHEPVPIPGDEAMPIRSNHKEGEEALNYIITRDGKTLLYASDMGWYEEDALEILKGHKVDAAIFECTFGLEAAPREWARHLGLPEVARWKETLEAQGTLKPGAQVIITHFSHNNLRPHEELEEAARAHGIAVAYDGMRIRVGQ